MIEQVLTMKRTAALCLVGAFCSLNAQAQNIQVKGNLVDGTGEPLIGATVKVKGNASVGAVTDLDGNASRASRESSGFRAQVIRVSTRITSSILSPIARTTSLMQYMFIPGGMEI